MKSLTLSTCMFLSLATLHCSEAILQPASKKVLFLIAFNKFDPIEYTAIKNKMMGAGFSVTLASNQKGNATATDGKTTAPIDKPIYKINPAKYAAIIFLGGEGILDSFCTFSQGTYKTDRCTINLVQRAFNQKKIMGAICLATRCFLDAGILKEKRAAGWDGDKELWKKYTSQGVFHDARPVVVDGSLITASPLNDNVKQCAEDFAEKIIQALKNQK